MNKADICIVSGNPFVYNLYIQNCRKNFLPMVDCLHVYRDLTFCPSYEKEISRFYAESTLDVPVRLGNVATSNDYAIFKTGYINQSAKAGKSKVFVSMHEDFMILNGNVFQNHIDLIANDEKDIVCNGFGTSCPEIDDLIREWYPNVVACYKDKQQAFGVGDYWMMSREVISDENIDPNPIVVRKGEVLNDVLPNGEGYIMKEYAVPEPFIKMLLQVYKRGHQRVHVHSTEEHIAIFSLTNLKNFVDFYKIGYVHLNGGRYGHFFLNVTEKLHSLTFGDMMYLDWFVERLWTMTISYLLFFDFQKYPYLKEFAYSLFVPKIKQKLDEINAASGRNVKMNVDMILMYGKQMGVETFPENVKNL